MITECRFILVGIVLTYSKEFDVFRVDHVYRPDVVIEGAEFVMRRGEDCKLLIPFATIVKAFISIYGSQLRIGWHRDATHAEQWYLQLRKVGSPSWVGLDGSWMRWVEK